MPDRPHKPRTLQDDLAEAAAWKAYRQDVLKIRRRILRRLRRVIGMQLWRLYIAGQRTRRRRGRSRPRLTR